MQIKIYLNYNNSRLSMLLQLNNYHNDNVMELSFSDMDKREEYQIEIMHVMWLNLCYCRLDIFPCSLLCALDSNGDLVN